MDIEKEIRTATAVFVTLLVFTGLSVLASTEFQAGRAAAILIALGIAWFKAGLIGYHFMHLKQERTLVWIILLIAIVAVLALAIGVLPDLAVYRG